MLCLVFWARGGTASAPCLSVPPSQRLASRRVRVYPLSALPCVADPPSASASLSCAPCLLLGCLAVLTPRAVPASLSFLSSSLPLCSPGKLVLIMDEVDGMSSSDRGGVAELIQCIHQSKTPIICICNGTVRRRGEEQSEGGGEHGKKGKRKQRKIRLSFCFCCCAVLAIRTLLHACSAPCFLHFCCSCSCRRFSLFSRPALLQTRRATRSSL